MKKLKQILTTILAFLIFGGTLCASGTLGSKTPSVSATFYTPAMDMVSTDVVPVSDSLFFIEPSIVKVNGTNIFVYDKKDSTIKVIDKETNTYRSENDNYRFYNLKEMIIFEDVLMLLNNENNTFKCLNANSFEEINFDSQNKLATLDNAKEIKIINMQDKSYILVCPTNPITNNFEIAEITKEEKLISGTETENVIEISNPKTFKMDETWAESELLSSYEQLFISKTDDNKLFLVFLTNNTMYSFVVDPENIDTNPYKTLTPVTGIESTEQIDFISLVSIKENQTALAIMQKNKINFYTLTTNNAHLEKISNLSIDLEEYSVYAQDSDGSTLVLSSSESQNIRIFNFVNEEPYYNEQQVVNSKISVKIFDNQNFKYLKAVQKAELLDTPYSKDPIISIEENEQLVFIGEGQYENGDSVVGWYYCMYTKDSFNFYGYVDSISLNEMQETTFEKEYITVLGHTKLYSMPSKLTDRLNTEIKVIQNSSRLQVLSALCGYEAEKSRYVLVKVNGEDIGFIDVSRILTTSSIEDRIIPNATVKRDNSEIFTTTEVDKEVIITLNKGARVKVIGKRDTIKNYTKVSFNDAEGNEYTGYIYTYNLESDSWTMLQIIGMFLVSLNVILLIVIICVKNRVTR